MGTAAVAAIKEVEAFAAAERASMVNQASNQFLFDANLLAHEWISNGGDQGTADGWFSEIEAIEDGAMYDAAAREQRIAALFIGRAKSYIDTAENSTDPTEISAEYDKAIADFDDSILASQTAEGFFESARQAAKALHDAIKDAVDNLVQDETDPEEVPEEGEEDPEE